MAFASAMAEGSDWRTAMEKVTAALAGRTTGHSLGFLFTTGDLADDLDPVLAELRRTTGVQDWVGTTGTGICGTGSVAFDRPAISVMTCDLDPDQYRLFSPSGEVAAVRDGGWEGSFAPPVIITHGDPEARDVLETTAMVAESTGGFLVGGLTASRSRHRQIAGRMISGGLSGAVLSPDIEVVAGLTQGCTPIGPSRTITEAMEHVLVSLDDEPAFVKLMEDTGELLARDLQQLNMLVFAALPVAGSDTGDYLVRNLIGLDPSRGLVAIADRVFDGDRVMFVRRDPEGAERDMRRLIGELKERTGGRQPRGGLYYSCVARGPALFADPAFEAKAIAEAFGEMPLAGFFGNGEIFNNRLYGYTGVLTLLM
jgi:small ligand-binding sensory domain FIST